MVSIQKIQNRRIHRKPQIVTYDWLEDSIDAKKPIQRTEKYNPGKPRDVDGMVAAWKEAKFSVKAGKYGTLKTFPKKLREEAGQQVSPTSLFEANVVNEEDGKAGDETAADSKVIDSSGAIHDQKKQDTGKESTISARRTQQSTISQPTLKPKKVLPPKVVTEVYKDETDGFPYQIELTPLRPSPEASKYTMEVKMTTNRVPTRFSVEAFRYDEKGKQNLRRPVAWFQSAKEALGDFRWHFLQKTGYSWDERLLKCSTKEGNGGQCSRWLYEPPALGKPTGAVHPEYTPDHPKCVKPQVLLPTAMRRPAGFASASKPFGFNNSIVVNTMKRSVSNPPGPASTRKIHNKVRFAVPQAPKRKLEERPPSEHRAKARKMTEPEGETPLLKTKH